MALNTTESMFFEMAKTRGLAAKVDLYEFSGGSSVREGLWSFDDGPSGPRLLNYWPLTRRAWNPRVPGSWWLPTLKEAIELAAELRAPVKESSSA